MHEAAVSAIVQQRGIDNRHEPGSAEFPHLRSLRLGVHVSMGARQAVRAVGTALGMEGPRVNAIARQVPLLSSPGAIDNVMTHAPELGIPDASSGAEPYTTLVRVAGQLEGLPHRYGAHPSAYTFSFHGPSALDWLPAQWVSDGRPGRRRAFGAARHLAVVADERVQTAALAHQAAPPANAQSAIQGDVEDDPSGAASGMNPADRSGPVIALQWTKDDLEALGLVRLDISPTAAMPTSASTSSDAEQDPATVAAAWRLLQAGDTLCISQVEGVGFRMLLKRAHELALLQAQQGQAFGSVEDLAQLLALWKPGVYSKEREQAYFDARFAARDRPAYPHPSMGKVLDETVGPGPVRGPVGRACHTARLRPRLGRALSPCTKRRSSGWARPHGAGDPRSRCAPSLDQRTEHGSAWTAVAARGVSASSRPRARYGPARVSTGVRESESRDRGELLCRRAEQRRLAPVRPWLGRRGGAQVWRSGTAAVRESERRPFSGGGVQRRATWSRGRWIHTRAAHSDSRARSRGRPAHPGRASRVR